MRWYVHNPRLKRVQRRSKTITASSRRAAERELTRLLAQHGDGGDGLRLVDFLADHLKRTAAHKTAGHAQNQERNLRRHLTPALGDLTVADVTPRILEDVYGELAGKGLSPQTVRHCHWIIHSAFEAAIRLGEATSNPAANARLGPLKRQPIQPPTIGDLLAILTVADSTRPDLGLFLRLAVVTGARRGELCALRWGSIDWTRSRVLIGASVHEAAGQPLTVKSTKTGRARPVEVDDGTLQGLENWHRLRLDAGAFVDDHHFVFSPDGRTPARPSNMTAAFARARRDAGVEGVRLHDLRHFSISALLGLGIPTLDVSHRAGHSKTSTTTDLYGHLMAGSDHDRRAATLLAKLLEQPQDR